MHDLTHASFFSGGGGLDLGLERAGWRTVSFSEIDPYACAILAERWPGVPNLGDIVQLAHGHGLQNTRERDGAGHGVRGAGGPDWNDAELRGADGPSGSERLGRVGGLGAHGSVGRSDADRDAWRDATLWTGGFPCQDLSIAGKRRGLDGARSGLAFAYLGLVERHRPPWVLLENVPGLLSSNRGRDLSVLLGRLSELGYGVAYRVLDARYFGVAQRRRRVFILASRDPGGRAGAERAAEVLSIAASGGGHPATSREARAGTAGGADDGAIGSRFFNATAAFGAWESGDTAGTLSRRDYKTSNHLFLANAVSASTGHHGHSSPRGDGSDNLVVHRPWRCDWCGHDWLDHGGLGPNGPYLCTWDFYDYDDDREICGCQASPPDDARGQGRGRQGAADLGQREPDAGHVPDADAVRRPLGPSPDTLGDRAPDGLAGRAHDRGGVAATLNSGGNSGGFRTEPGEHLVTSYRKATKAHHADDWERWEADDMTDALTASGLTPRTDMAAVGLGPTWYDTDPTLLPLGLDSNRYRVCGNGVVSNVAEAIGRALLVVMMTDS